MFYVLQNAEASYDFSSNDPYPYPRYTDDWFNRYVIYIHLCFMFYVLCFMLFFMFLILLYIFKEVTFTPRDNLRCYLYPAAVNKL